MKKQNNFDVVLVLGTGIDSFGIIPESAVAKVKKAVQFHKAGNARFIIFSGKYSHSSKFTPPTTEAKAMAELALNLGVEKNNIFLEDESYSTVSNICLVKKNIL